MKRKRLFTLGCLGVLVAAVAVFGLLQLVPYGRSHTNPPVVQEPPWDGAETRALAQRACFDCHSNETAWPPYSNVAPASWLVQRHVDEGREKLNFSNWGAVDEDELSEPVREGEMPMKSYVILHPAARLSSAELQQLVSWLDTVAPAHGEDGD